MARQERENHTVHNSGMRYHTTAQPRMLGVGGDEGGGGYLSTRRISHMTNCRKGHLVKPTDSSPNRESNPFSSSADSRPAENRPGDLVVHGQTSVSRAVDLGSTPGGLAVRRPSPEQQT